jgi:hypothetical protein
VGQGGFEIELNDFATIILGKTRPYKFYGCLIGFDTIPTPVFLQEPPAPLSQIGRGVGGEGKPTFAKRI